MPDWSPVRRWGGYGAWGAYREGGEGAAPLSAAALAAACACATACQVHGHAHAQAWSARAPVDDNAGFWGALGCACWAL